MPREPGRPPFLRDRGDRDDRTGRSHQAGRCRAADRCAARRQLLACAPARPGHLHATGLGTQLVGGIGDVGLNHPDLATDDAGGTFLFPAAATVPDCVVVAYRPAHGRFRIGYGSSFNRTVLIDPDGRDASPPFSQEHAPIGGVSADADGALTLGWWECASLNGCSINAATADMDGRTYPRHVLAPSAIQLRVADGALAWESCGPHHGCRVDTDPVLAGHRFATPERIGTGKLVALKDDHHGYSLVVWDAPGGRVHAALRTAGSARFGPARTLSAPGVDASTITAAYAQDGEAVIAWSAAGETHAALYLPSTKATPLGWNPRYPSSGGRLRGSRRAAGESQHLSVRRVGNRHRSRVLSSETMSARWRLSC